MVAAMMPHCVSRPRCASVFGEYEDYIRRVDCSPMDGSQLGKMLGLNTGAEVAKRCTAMKLAIRQAIHEKDCTCASMDCWPSAMLLKGLPCVALGELADEGIPVSCEGDINGAVTLAIMNACAMGETSRPSIFPNWEPSIGEQSTRRM